MSRGPKLLYMIDVPSIPRKDLSTAPVTTAAVGIKNANLDPGRHGCIGSCADPFRQFPRHWLPAVVQAALRDQGRLPFRDRRKCVAQLCCCSAQVSTPPGSFLLCSSINRETTSVKLALRDRSQALAVPQVDQDRTLRRLGREIVECCFTASDSSGKEWSAMRALSSSSSA